MVRMSGVGQEVCTLDILFEVVADQVVVDAPPFVVVSGVGPVAPPAVLVGLGVKVTKRVHKPVIHKSVDPRPLFGQKAGNVFVPHGVVNIDGLVTDIVVATDDQSGMFFSELIDIGLKIVHKLELVIEAVEIGSRGEIKADDGNLMEIGTHDPAFEVYVRDSGALLYVEGFSFGENGNSTISFFLGRVPVVFIAQLFKNGSIYLFFQSFGFLQAKDIGLRCLKPVGKTFVEGCSDAVDVVRKDFQS